MCLKVTKKVLYNDSTKVIITSTIEITNKITPKKFPLILHILNMHYSYLIPLYWHLKDLLQQK